jgi:hypothetical protein
MRLPGAEKIILRPNLSALTRPAFAANTDLQVSERR